MKNYKTVIVCPWWGRPDVVELHCKSMKKFIKGHAEYLAVLSPEDPHVERLEKLTYLYGFRRAYFKNFPLGCKINHGVNLVKNEFDYIMNMGSDDLCDPRYWRDIKDFMGKPLFKVNCIYASEDLSLKRIWEIRNLNIGVLRMIRTDIIPDNLYPAQNKGLDKGSRKVLVSLGYGEEVVPPNLIYAIDVKSDESITPVRKWLRKNGKLARIDLNRFL